MDNEITIIESAEMQTDTRPIRDFIYIVRGQQVMLDSDLAMLYKVETGALNRAVKRNIKRFPEDFRFQLTKQEYESLRCQNGISSQDASDTEHGGRRYRPYVFTEPGISMLASVLRSRVAVNVSISIIRAFVEMRRFIANNAALFERISSVELRQLEYQKQTDEKFDKVFEYIDDHAESEQKIFFDGQIYDAFELLISLVQKATKKIVLIDGYVDTGTLNILAKKNIRVDAMIYTFSNTRLSQKDITTFNAQYPNLTVKHMAAFHDRFLILDDEIGCHVGASLKDAGKKCFGITQIQDKQTIQDILKRL